LADRREVDRRNGVENGISSSFVSDRRLQALEEDYRGQRAEIAPVATISSERG
jgi:hypothetical protein